MEALIYSIVSTVVTGFVTFFFTRKKYLEEVLEQHIDNQAKSLEFYIKLIDDNGLRLEKLLLANVALEQQVKSLKEQVTQLTEQLKKYEEAKKKTKRLTKL